MTIELRDRGKQRGTFAANGVAINSYERFAALLAKGMEAVTLLVAVVLPMVISPFADAYFEVPKAFFVRVTALAQGVLLLGWAGSTWLGRRRRGLPLWGGDGVEVLRRQMICAALALAGVSLLTAVTAVNRGYAMVGCPQRGGGALSVLSGVIFFIAAAVSLRRRVQGERVVAAISMGCLPCVVFALCEMVGVHPMGFNIKGVGWRLSGSLGNANFLGSFFALTTPLVAGNGLAGVAARAGCDGCDISDYGVVTGGRDCGIAESWTVTGAAGCECSGGIAVVGGCRAAGVVTAFGHRGDSWVCAGITGIQLHDCRAVTQW